MKRILLMLGLGLVIINVTNGCNKSGDDSTSTTPAVTSTNATTNAVPPPAH